MANIILGYIVIGLMLSGLYIWKAEETETMRLLSRKGYISTLTFTVALITIFWGVIGLFAIIRVLKSRLWETNSDERKE